MTTTTKEAKTTAALEDAKALLAAVPALVALETLDGRNQYDSERLAEYGLRVFPIGLALPAR